MCGDEPCINLGNRYTDCGHVIDETVTYTLSDLRAIVAVLESFAEKQDDFGRNERSAG